MPITNLAIQRSRWKELKRILGDTEVIEIKPVETTNYSEFIIKIGQLRSKHIMALRANGYSFQDIIPWKDGLFAVVKKWDIEKQSEYVRRVAAETNKRDVPELNYELLNRHCRKLEARIRELEQQVDNLQVLRTLVGEQE